MDESEEWSSQLISNLSNWKEEAWKNQGFNGIRTRDLRDTGAMLYQLSYEATHWERGQFEALIHFIYTSHHFPPHGDMNSINWPRSQCVASYLSW